MNGFFHDVPKNAPLLEPWVALGSCLVPLPRGSRRLASWGMFYRKSTLPPRILSPPIVSCIQSIMLPPFTQHFFGLSRGGSGMRLGVNGQVGLSICRDSTAGLCSPHIATTATRVLGRFCISIFLFPLRSWLTYWEGGGDNDLIIAYSLEES